MRASCLFGVVSLSLSACASTASPKPPVCDGKHLRPANLYGSVLPKDSEDGRPPSTTAPLKDGEGNGTPKALSALDPQSFASCGGLA